MHFTAYVVLDPVPNSDFAVSAAVEDRIARFHVEADVPEYKERVTFSEIRRMADHYGFPAPASEAELRGPVARIVRPRSVAGALMGEPHTIGAGEHPAIQRALDNMESWRGAPGHRDDEGIYILSTANPDAHYDYWSLDISFSEEIAAPRPNAPEFPGLITLDPSCPNPYAIVVDGEWHEARSPDMDILDVGRDAFLEEMRRLEAVWAEDATELLRIHAGRVAAVIDCHF